MEVATKNNIKIFLQVNYTRLEQVMTATEQYERLKHKIAVKSTPAERISFMRALIALYGNELSDKQIGNLKRNIKLAERQALQHEKA